MAAEFVPDSLYTRLAGPYGQFNMLYNRQGMGRLGRDKAVGQEICPQRILTRRELRDLYRSNSIIQRIVDYTSCAGTRRWLEPLKIADDSESDVPDELKSYWKRLKVKSFFAERDRLARQFGGACIFVGADDGKNDLEEPLDEEKIKTISYLKAFDRWDIYPAPGEQNLVDPEVYIWYPSIVGEAVENEETRQILPGTRIHSSRILRQDGIDLPRIDMNENNGWGDSVIQGFIKAYLDAVSNLNHANHMMASHDIWIQSIAGLADILSTPGGQENITQHVLENLALLAQYGLYIQDAEHEGSSYVSHAFGGISDVMQRSFDWFTASAGVPHYVIWGSVGEAGLADSGGAEKRAESDLVLGYTEVKWGPDLERLAELTFAADDFEGEEPDDWELKFKSLYQPTEMEEAELQKTITDTDKVRVDMGAIAPEEARMRLTGTEFMTELVVPEELPESLQPQDPLAGLGLEGETATPTGESLAPAQATEEGTEQTEDPLAGLQVQDQGTGKVCGSSHIAKEKTCHIGQLGQEAFKTREKAERQRKKTKTLKKKGASEAEIKESIKKTSKLSREATKIEKQVVKLKEEFRSNERVKLTEDTLRLGRSFVDDDPKLKALADRLDSLEKEAAPRMESMRKLATEIKSAADAGDTERIDVLRDRFVKERSDLVDFRAGLEEADIAFGDAVVAKLTALNGDRRISVEDLAKSVERRGISQEEYDFSLQAMSDFSAITGKDPRTAVGGLEKTDPRAHYDGTDINIGNDVDRTTLFHEMSHGIEGKSDLLSAASQGFIASRAQGPAVPINDLIENGRYSRLEKAVPDEFIHPYVGKEYLESITTENKPSEVLSMGWQHFAEPNMLANFRRGDKGHFDLTIGQVLLGRDDD